LSATQAAVDPARCSRLPLDGRLDLGCFYIYSEVCVKPIIVAGFPITEDVGLRKCGSHLDIGFEVSNHSRRERDDYFGADRSGGTWCYYVIVGEQMLSAEEFAEFWLEPSGVHTRASGWDMPSYDYYSARFAAANWHGGVTYFEKLGGIDGQPRFVKIGCDFAHLWDEGRFYDYEIVEREAIATIEALRAMYSFRRRCAWNGKWLPEAEMVAGEHGRLYSPDGLAAATASRAKVYA
jgi:hypothetical protein